ncbi:MAG: PDZ domain-containing protein, partial [Actinobacteria bacterium]
MTGRVALAVVLVLATTAAAAERPPAEIVGSVIAHRAGAVQVSFGSHPEAVPRAGDRVEFSVEIDGIRVDAGAGKVLDVTRQSAWVEIEKGRPDLGMQARIHATGRLDRQEAGGDAPLQEPGRAVRAYLGVQVKPLGRELAGALGLDTWAGALVDGVAPGSPAETAGFRKNDLIVEFDGNTIDEMLELHRRVAVTPVGQEVAVKVLRGGKPLTLAVKLGKLPALPALPPPDGDGLQPRVLGRGVAQILVPVGLPMIEDKKTASRWRVSSPETDRLTDAWWMLVFDHGEVRRPLEEEHGGLAARIFAESKDAPRWRWRNRRISAAMECLASSTTLFRYASWSVLCRKDGRDYVIHVTADSGPLRDPDAVIERIVRSFRVGDDVTWYAVPPPPRIDALEPQTLDGIVALELP